jgi:ABC-type phosphate transport system substrate-binding protein
MKIVIVTLLFLFSWAEASFSQVAVIAHKSVSVDTIKKSELLDFYTGDIRKWNDKQPVVILDLKPRGDTKKAFYKFLGKRPSRMKSIWLKKMLSGEGDPPVFMSSEEEMLKKVASTPGAIGFVNQAKISEEVKILLAINEVKK